MPDDELPVPDLNDPLFRFINGIMEIFYGEDPVQHPEAVEHDVLRGKVAALLDSLPRPIRRLPLTAQQQAAEMAQAAWDAPEDEHSPYLALEALTLSADCADAYSFLGISAGEELALAIPILTLAVMAGYETLGQAAFEEHTGHFWALPETRPFMRALGELARVNREAGATDVAIAHYDEMLRLNPADDQGARYELLSLALEAGQHDLAEKILAAYQDDASPAMPLGAALLSYQRTGDTDASRALLKAAIEPQPLLAPFILGLLPLPEVIRDDYELGGEEEAAIFASLLQPAFEATGGAMDWLRTQAAAAAPRIEVVTPPSKERRSGPRQV
jgi:tetratricopeptide (TPR) repeat protein